MSYEIPFWETELYKEKQRRWKIPPLIEKAMGPINRPNLALVSSDCKKPTIIQRKDGEIEVF